MFFAKEKRIYELEGEVLYLKNNLEEKERKVLYLANKLSVEKEDRELNRLGNSVCIEEGEKPVSRDMLTGIPNKRRIQEVVEQGRENLEKAVAEVLKQVAPTVANLMVDSAEQGRNHVDIKFGDIYTQLRQVTACESLNNLQEMVRGPKEPESLYTRDSSASRYPRSLCMEGVPSFYYEPKRLEKVNNFNIAKVLLDVIAEEVERDGYQATVYNPYDQRLDGLDRAENGDLVLRIMFN